MVFIPESLPNSNGDAKTILHMFTVLMLSTQLLQQWANWENEQDYICFKTITLLFVLA